MFNIRQIPAAAATVAAAILALAPAALLLTGCARKPELTAPPALVAPYDLRGGDVLWAVVPLRNESGAGFVDVFEVSDKVVAAAAQVRGVRVLPLNRTLAAMRALELPELASPADARRLAAELGVDALLVGSITAYDPYDPPTLGLALALHARPGALTRPGSGLDVAALRYQPTDYRFFPRSTFEDGPASVVSEHLDGKNHRVVLAVQRYAEGRHDPGTALGWRRYLASMDLFTEFGAWHTMARLLEHESLRLARAVESGRDDGQGRGRDARRGASGQPASYPAGHPSGQPPRRAEAGEAKRR